jgi:hypothetical protein
MNTIVLVITVSTVALAVLCKDRLRRIAPVRRPPGGVLVDKTQGFARLELPSGWRPARDLNETASIEAIEPLRGRHVIVISDAIEDFVPEMTIYEHSMNTRSELTNSIRVVACSGPSRRTVGGFDAVQYEIDGFFQQTRIKYLHTTVAGKRAFHQVLAWATYTRYNRDAFEHLLNGFSESSGPPPSVEPKPTLPLELQSPVPASRYEVH